MVKSKKGKIKIEISKKTLVIISIVIVIAGLLIFYLYNSDKLGIIFKKPLGKTEIISELEAAEKLTNVAEDISSLKEDLGSLTKGISKP